MPNRKERSQTIWTNRSSGPVPSTQSGDPDPTINPVNHGRLIPVAHSDITPLNQYDALMQCPPGTDPAVSRAELEPLREMICDAFDVLSDRERWIADALLCRKLSYRQLGRELSLSKTHVARLKEEIISKLRIALLDTPGIGEYVVT